MAGGWRAGRKARRTAAEAKAIGGGDRSTTTDGGSTDSTMLQESWPDVDDWAESGDDVQVDAADRGEFTVGRMQVVGEVIDGATVLRESAGAGVLLADGRVHQQLEQELECTRLEYARQVLWGDDYSSEGAGSDGYEGSLEEFSARSDGGFEACGGRPPNLFNN